MADYLFPDRLAPRTTAHEQTASRAQGRSFATDDVIVRGVLPTLIVVYGLLALAGQATFITKTLVFPLLFAYGLLHRDRIAFLRDWGPYLGATLLFDALRGFVFVLVEHGILKVHRTYVILLEGLLTGTPALPLPLQTQWRSLALDRFFVTLHGTHFLMFLFVGLLVWHLRRDEFWRYRQACVGVMFVGLACYALVPTVPPWLAAQQGAIPPVVAISHEIYANGIPPVVLRALDTNPVAAMPSLHMAFPTVCTILVWGLWGMRAGAPMLLYTLLQGIGIIYLGEHYLVDVLAGVTLAGVIACETYRRRQPRLRHLSQAMVRTALILLATGMVYLLSATL